MTRSSLRMPLLRYADKILWGCIVCVPFLYHILLTKAVKSGILKSLNQQKEVFLWQNFLSMNARAAEAG